MNKIMDRRWTMQEFFLFIIIVLIVSIFTGSMIGKGLRKSYPSTEDTVKDLQEYYSNNNMFTPYKR